MKLKIGIVGYGAIGKAHYAELRRSDKFEVCGVFDKNCKDEFCRAPQFENFKDFIAQSHPQALVLCVEQKELFDAFNECAKFCQNILIACGEFKNLDRLKELNHVAKSAKIRVCAGFSDRFRPAIVSLQKALSKESEIYGIHISYSKPNLGADIISGLCLPCIDLAKTIAKSEIYEFSSSFSNKTNSRSSDNALIKFKSKNQILTSVLNSHCGTFERFNVEINAKSGAYFGDLIANRLFELTEDGQINLKIDADQNEIKVQYDAFFDYCVSGEIGELSTLDDVIKIMELFA